VAAAAAAIPAATHIVSRIAAMLPFALLHAAVLSAF